MKFDAAVAGDAEKVKSRKTVFKCSSLQDLLKYFVKTPAALKLLEGDVLADHKGLYHDFAAILAHVTGNIVSPVKATEEQKKQVGSCIRKYALTRLYPQ